MTEILTLPAALALDLALGDPATSWHPVRLLGRYAAWVEARTYGQSRAWLRGAVAFVAVIGIVVLGAWLLYGFACRAHPAVGFAVGSLMTYAAVVPRDLATHGQRVFSALARNDLVESRQRVGAIVGRDTDLLDSPEICRAAVEAVAESTVDGIVAPLFWACVLGPVGALGYRVVNTLDSMWGHRDARYARFGTVAARADDLLNYLPARLALLWIAAAALVLGLNARAALWIGVRHGPRHASPNSGLPEAAFAGALEVTLGGCNRYDGQWHEGPTFGSVSAKPEPRHLVMSLRLMWGVTIIGAAALTLCRMAFAAWSAR
jgi:adenosylcobinamide-phosphate synthase